MRFGFVVKHRGTWPVDVLCGALGVSRSGFYAWVTRGPSRRARADIVVGAAVRTSFVASDRNISALVQVLRGAPGLTPGIPLEALAEHLAAGGVLYPAALTDDQAVELGADAVGSLPTDPSEIALCVRAGLERIARGDR